ncbi:MAG: glycosyltransferase family 4 protein [Gammaproteobacteria bacterium]|nr:glycosyltransferase family 4 protein [Gammaproteobacteria bacterium]MBL7003301.1 glycosyltransferase family 4 protein [Gammaproteobacteria bacterium]
MKKTLLISEIFPPIHGGSGRWFWELYSRLPKEQYFIAAGLSDGHSEYDKQHDLNVTRLPLSSPAWGIKSLTGLSFYWKNFLKIRSLVKKNCIHQIHCGRCLPEGVFGYLMKKLYNIPYLCYIHGEDVEAASSSRELSYIVKKVLDNASRLITNSKNSQRILINHWKVNPDKTVVLNPGMDSKRFIPARYNLETRKKLGWDNRSVVLTVGRLQKRKGQDMLIQALLRIKKDIPDILYAIIGGGEEKEHLQTLVEKLNLKENVQFCSEISDEEMIQCYQQCTLFALPNRTIGKDIEGFGMVLAEAQSCGRPVLAGDSGGTVETMIIGETGYIVDCTSSEILAKKIIALLKEPDLLSAMGQKARKHAEETLDWDVHTQKAIKIFNSISQ